MGAEFESRLDELLDRALAVAPERREAFVVHECAGDDRLAEALRRMLVVAARVPSDFLGADADETPARTAPLPASIGQYRVIRELGRGGMGIVYEAEQTSPRRAVAVKVLRQGLATAETLRRFELEAEILGRLQHRGIAHIYEAGTATIGESDWPFLAMELVAGEPVDAYAARRALPVAHRLELVARVCDAVQHAHQRGVIHRDLKAANVLVVEEATTGTSAQRTSTIVDAIGQPKVLDFGIARAVAADDRSLVTNAGQLVGTLAAMSPEQVDGPSADLDTRCDVYALGVLLVVVLTGALPIDVAGVTIAEAARRIREAEPRLPSSFRDELRPEIETIVAHALAKERDRRYASAADLADDLRRCVRHEPLLAHPPSTLYQFRKYARRHKAAVLGLATTAVALVLGVVGTAWFAVASDRARADADAHALEAIRAADRASLAAAAAALREQDVVSLRRHLDAIPPSRRHWEWAHFDALSDESIATAALAPDGGEPRPRRITFATMHVWFDATGDRIFATYRGEAPGAPDPAEVRTFDADSLEPLARWVHPALEGGPVRVVPGDLVLVHANGAFAAHDAASGAVVAALPRVAELPDAARLSTTAPIPLCFLEAPPPALVPSIGSLGQARRVVVAPDGSVMLAWQRQRVEAIRRDGTRIVLEDHPDSISGAVFLDGGRTVVTAGRNRRLAAFDLDDGGRRLWERIDAHPDALTAIESSPDGSLLATGGQDRIIRLWDARTGAPRGALMGHRASVAAVAFRADGRRLASVGADELKVWDLDAAASPAASSPRSAVLTSIAATSDGALLATTGDRVQVWDARAELLVAELAPVEGAVYGSAAFSPDGRLLAFHARDRRQGLLGTFVVDRRTGRVVAEAADLLELRFAPDDRDAVALSPDGLAVALDAVTLERRRTLAHDASTGAFLPDGAYVVAARDATLRIVDPADGVVRRTIALEAPVHRLHVLADGRTIAIVAPDDRLALVDLDVGAVVGSTPRHIAPIRSIAELARNGRLVTGCDDRTIHLWDRETLAEATDLRGHLDAVLGLVAAPDEGALHSVSGDHALRRWDTRPVRELLEARRAHAASAARLDPIVRDAFARLGDPDAVVAFVERLPDLSARDREIALERVLVRALAR